MTPGPSPDERVCRLWDSYKEVKTRAEDEKRWQTANSGRQRKYRVRLTSRLKDILVQ